MKHQTKGLCSTQKTMELLFSEDLLPDEIYEPKTNDVLVKIFEKLEKSTPIKLAGFHTHTVKGTNT